MAELMDIGRQLLGRYDVDDVFLSKMMFSIWSWTPNTISNSFGNCMVMPRGVRFVAHTAKVRFHLQNEFEGSSKVGQG